MRALTYWGRFLESIQGEDWYDPTDANGDEELLERFYFWLVKEGMIS